MSRRPQLTDPLQSLLSRVLLSLALVFSFLLFGYDIIYAALTIDGTSLSSDGALTIKSASSSLTTIGDTNQSGTITIGSSTQALTINIGIGNASNTIFIGSASSSVGIGTASPEKNLHVLRGSAGSVSAWPDSIAVFENSTHGYISILTPDATDKGILFGDSTSNVSGSIIYDSPNALNGLDFRVDGNNTKMVVTSGGNVGIGTTSPSSTLHLLSSASSTLSIGHSTQTACIVMGDSDGSGVTYVTANNGVLSATSTKPSACQ